jgi:hypothetical protein
MRVYSVAEQDHLGAQCLGFISFLESAGVLPPATARDRVDRAMAAPGGPVAVDDLKIIVLMAYWSTGREPDALVLDELCDDTAKAAWRTDLRFAPNAKRPADRGPCVASASYASSRSGLASSLASASRVARTVSASSSAGTSRPACR